MGRAGSIALGLVLLAGCGGQGTPGQDTDSTEGGDFTQDSKVIQTAQCAHAALVAGESDGWDAALDALRARHEAMTGSTDAAARESSVMRVVLSAKTTLAGKGVVDQASAAAWRKDNCV